MGTRCISRWDDLAFVAKALAFAGASRLAGPSAPDHGVDDRRCDDHGLGLGAVAFLVTVAWFPAGGMIMPRWLVLAVGLPLTVVSSWAAWRCGRAWVYLVAGLIYAAMSIAWAPDRLGALQQLSQMGILAVAFVAGAGIVGARSFDLVMAFFAVGLMVSALLCVPQALGWSGIPQSAPPAGLFYNRDVLAETVAPVLVWAILQHRYTMTAVLLIPLLLCGSRVALFAAAVGLLYGLPMRWRWRLMGMAATLVAGLGLLLLMGREKAADALFRIVLWADTLTAITPFGHGIGSFAARNPVLVYAHSDSLQAAYELGIGALPLLAIPVLIWRRKQ